MAAIFILTPNILLLLYWFYFLANYTFYIVHCTMSEMSLSLSLSYKIFLVRREKKSSFSCFITSTSKQHMYCSKLLDLTLHHKSYHMDTISSSIKEEERGVLFNSSLTKVVYNHTSRMHASC